MARPERVLPPDAEKVAGAAAFAGAPDRDIAHALGVAVSTLKRRFGPELTKQRALRRIEIRRAQTVAARAGNATMLIWLGKQELGQRDVLEWAPGDMSKYSDEQLEAIASGRVKNQLRLVRKGA